MAGSLILVKGCSGTGKSTRLCMFLKYLEALGEELKPFKFKMADGVEKEIGLYSDALNLVLIGKYYKSGGIERWQGHDAVTGRFVNMDGLTKFLKDITNVGYNVLIEGAGTTATWRLRPKFLYEECGYSSVLHVLYNFDVKNRTAYDERIEYRSGKPPKSDAMWNKNKTFWSDYNTALKESKIVNSMGGNVQIYGVTHDAPIWDLGVKIFTYMGLADEINEFKAFCEKSDYIQENSYQSFKESGGGGLEKNKRVEPQTNKESKPTKEKKHKSVLTTSFAPNENFKYWLHWVCERMNIFWRKYNGEGSPWTQDPILQNFRFTNVYRSLDRVSQYLISNVIYNGKQYEPEDMFFRILLFKHFNKIETWELLEKEFGDITLEIDFEEIGRVLDDAVEQGVVLYSNAYIIGCFFYPFPEYAHIKHLNKHRIHLRIFNDEIFENGHVYDFLEAQSLEELFNMFNSMKIYGEFTAQQYAVDMNYSPLFNFDPNSFVTTGPGSIKGLNWAFDGANKKNYVDIIKWVHANWDELFFEHEKQIGEKFTPVPGLKPHLVSVQNCFCEIGKYAKGMGHKFHNNAATERIKNTYTPLNKGIEYVFPEKWGVKMPEQGAIIVD